MFFLNYHSIWKQKRSTTAKCIPYPCRQQKNEEFSKQNNDGRQEKVSTQSNSAFFHKKSVLFIIVVVVPFFWGYLAPNEKSLKRKKYNSFAFNASTISFLIEFCSMLFFHVFVSFHHSHAHRQHSDRDGVRESGRNENPIENWEQGYWCPNKRATSAEKWGRKKHFLASFL